jgi:hypothetical protein
MMLAMDNTPKPLKGAFRVVLDLKFKQPRLDAVLLEALRSQSENLALKNISRTAFKDLFDKGAIKIKGQRARPSSSLVAGLTYVDILGFGEKEVSK